MCVGGALHAPALNGVPTRKNGAVCVGSSVILVDLGGDTGCEGLITCQLSFSFLCIFSHFLHLFAFTSLFVFTYLFPSPFFFDRNPHENRLKIAPGGA